jgi:hypothetical protein
MCGYPVSPAAFVEEATFSPSCVLGSFAKYQLGIDAWVYIQIFYPDPFVFLFVFCASTMMLLLL